MSDFTLTSICYISNYLRVSLFGIRVSHNTGLFGIVQRNKNSIQKRFAKAHSSNQNYLLK